MKHIRKSQPEPAELANYRERFAAAPRPPTWSEFKADFRRREPVKARLRQDQRNLCAYYENSLIPQDESVEHFLAKSSPAGRPRQLDWSNLLLCCGGGEKPLPEDVDDAAVRFEGNGERTCGHAKLANPAAILNPLQLPPTPRLFQFSSENGAIHPDVAGCRAAGVEVALVENTITVLNLRAGRLNRARHALLWELRSQLDVDGAAPAITTERASEIAAQQIPATGALPAFFTTIRWVLGQGAETHLQAVGFIG
jgi:uncharacterized protein (TIGR02646 family)